MQIQRSEEIYQRIKETRQGKHLTDAMYPIKPFNLTDIHRSYETGVSRETFSSVINRFFEIAYDKVILENCTVDMGVWGVITAKKQKNKAFVIRDMFKNFHKLGGRLYSYKDIKNRGGFYPYFTYRAAYDFIKDRFYVHFGMAQRMRLMHYFFDKGYDFPLGRTANPNQLLAHIRMVEKYERLRKQKIRERLNL